MGNDERVLLTVTAVALVALLIGKYKPDLLSPSMDDRDTSVARSNLTYNQPAWGYAPFTAGVIPNSAASQNGVPIPDASSWSNYGFGSWT